MEQKQEAFLLLQSSLSQILKPTSLYHGDSQAFLSNGAMGYRFMGEVMHFKEVCALNIVMQSDPNEKLFGSHWWVGLISSLLYVLIAIWLLEYSIHICLVL